jgi:ssDNA-binding Zn-finger/Zn-ribbon topoisomerase 1
MWITNIFMGIYLWITLLTFMWYYRVMECKHYYEIDLDGKVTCSNCHAIVDEIETYDNDFWSSQMSFEE